MGEVYRARDHKLGREVAIKVLPEEFARDSGRVARFEREARMLAAVNHPRSRAIYGAEEDGATRYIVMELVAGDTLADRLMRGGLPDRRRAPHRRRRSPRRSKSRTRRASSTAT